MMLGWFDRGGLPVGAYLATASETEEMGVMQQGLWLIRTSVLAVAVAVLGCAMRGTALT